MLAVLAYLSQATRTMRLREYHVAGMVERAHTFMAGRGVVLQHSSLLVQWESTRVAAIVGERSMPWGLRSPTSDGRRGVYRGTRLRAQGLDDVRRRVYWRRAWVLPLGTGGGAVLTRTGYAAVPVQLRQGGQGNQGERWVI